jgi:hypothetical protein
LCDLRVQLQIIMFNSTGLHIQVLVHTSTNITSNQDILLWD